uniref:Malate synthase n=1 Tax=Rhabditophanes sp. KR3021 TaxID=114890 RepID=A0AC35TZ39_9BILA
MLYHSFIALWADVFKFTENKLNLPKGSIKCTVLIEHLLASFEMEEIVYNLKDYIIGLNCGRWDYIFSYIKCFRNQLRITPDRLNISMTTPFLKAYSQEVIRTSHRRGIFAMGGMAAAIPNRADAVANNKALQSVINDKERESSSGHDGTWVAHPGLVPLAMKVFDEAIEGDNQIHRQLEGYITNKQLTEIPRGPKTSLGLRNNISVTLQYLEAWLRGIGCVAINNSMEDAATAEICRAQLWQWINHGVKLDDGTIVTPELVKNAINQEMETRMVMVGSTSNRLVDASVMLEKFVLEETLSDFLTLDAYDKIVSEGR